jgi:hypothetical protein
MRFAQCDCTAYGVLLCDKVIMQNQCCTKCPIVHGTLVGGETVGAGAGEGVMTLTASTLHLAPLTRITCCDTDDQEYRHQVAATWPAQAQTRHALQVRQQ